MNDSIEIIQKLTQIETTQKHLRDDLAEIKSDIKDIRASNNDVEERLRNVELVQAECSGSKQSMSKSFSGFTAIISMIFAAVVSGVVTFLFGGFK